MESYMLDLGGCLKQWALTVQRVHCSKATYRLDLGGCLKQWALTVQRVHCSKATYEFTGSL